MNALEALKAALLILDVVKAAGQTASELQALLKTLHDEGRDLTDAEANTIRAKTDAMYADVISKLGARQAAG